MKLKVLGAALTPAGAAAHQHLDRDHDGELGAAELAKAPLASLQAIADDLGQTRREADAFVDGAAARRGYAGGALIVGGAWLAVTVPPVGIALTAIGAYHAVKATRQAHTAMTTAERAIEARSVLDVMIQERSRG